MRKVLNPGQLSESALQSIQNFHPDSVNAVEAAIQSNKFVVVGMKANPFVKKARTLLKESHIDFKYIEYGSYLSKWRERLALKLWSGWPTFPMVFIDGKLIGGFKELKAWSAQNKN